MTDRQLTDAATGLIQHLKRLGLTTGSAESCTGGNIARTITSIPGASEVFQGAVVAYSNDVKRRILGVSAASLDSYGAVSEPVAAEMASGARKTLGADCTMATSGIAGPGGGTAEKPVGTVCIAVSSPLGSSSVTHHFNGDRGAIVAQATLRAIETLTALLASH